MFASTLYRYVFNTWRFFAVMTIAAYILLVVTSILGVLCRLQFGNGLVEYCELFQLKSLYSSAHYILLRGSENGQENRQPRLRPRTRDR